MLNTNWVLSDDDEDNNNDNDNNDDDNENDDDDDDGECCTDEDEDAEEAGFVENLIANIVKNLEVIITMFTCASKTTSPIPSNRFQLDSLCTNFHYMSV